MSFFAAIISLTRAQVRRGIAVALPTCALMLAGCVTQPTEYREPTALDPAARVRLNGETFNRAWALVNEKYFDAHFRGVDWPAMRVKYRPLAAAAPDDTELYRVLNALCGELKESHLTAISPRRAHEQRVDARALIGIRWRVMDGNRVVTDVMPGSAAAEAGVQTGWIAISRDGRPLDETETSVTRLGQPVHMEFLDRADQPRSLQLEPRLINFQHLESRALAGGVRYLRFDRFDTGTMRWLSRELKTHRAAPAVVLDFRYNPGGNAFVLQVAVAEFFDHSVPTGAFIKRDGDERDMRGLMFFSAKYAGRVAILTSPATGSAAEIFSHVLQHHRRATVIGQKTAGAVILSRYYRLPGGGVLQLPFQDYVGLDGQRLEHRGVTPDIPVPLSTRNELRAGQDVELSVALAFFRQP